MLLDGSIVDQTHILMSVLGTYRDLTYIGQYHKMICNIMPKQSFYYIFHILGLFICSDKDFIAVISYLCIAERYFVTTDAHTFRES